MTPRENISNALSALQSAAEKIRRIENEAKDALFARDDPSTHRQKLEEKTKLLMELPDLVDPLLPGFLRGRQTQL